MKVTYELITENDTKNDCKTVTDLDIEKIRQLAELQMNKLLNELLKSYLHDGTTLVVKCKSVTNYLE